MRKKGWVVGASLMERWLTLGANAHPDKGRHDMHIVRMQWVLTYGRALSVYRAAKEQKVWVNELAQSRIVKDLIRGKHLIPSEVGKEHAIEFGNIGEDGTRQPGNALQFHDEWHVQYRDVRQCPVASPLDDLYAALGDFSFYFLVKGHVERIPDSDGKPRHKVTINKVGVYVKDSYDFNDRFGDRNPLSWVITQPLGIWGCATNYAGKHPIRNMQKGYHYVTNRDFREWRTKHGRGHGGDFLVFSNIMVFDTDDSFEF